MYNNKVWNSTLALDNGKMFSVNSFANQRLIFFLANSFKKVGMNVWLICFKALILHPLSREKGDAVEILEQRKGYEPKLMKTF